MIGDLAAGIFLVAVIYVLVRPGSQGVGFVQAFGTAFSALIRQATDIAGPAAENDAETGDGTDDGSEDDSADDGN